MLRLIDLLAVAVDDMRQGGDPRLPLELALVKVTRPAADLSRESLAYRLEQLESRPSTAMPGASTVQGPAPRHGPGARPPSRRSRRRGAARRSSSSSSRRRGSARSCRRSRRRAGSRRRRSCARRTRRGLEGDTLTLAFPPAAAFHRKLAEEPKNATVLRDALYEVTGRKLAVAFAVGDGAGRGRRGGARRAGQRGGDPRADEGHIRRRERIEPQ